MSIHAAQFAQTKTINGLPGIAVLVSLRIREED